MASVFVLLEAFNRKEAAALGFFPCAPAAFLLNGAAEENTDVNSNRYLSLSKLI